MKEMNWPLTLPLIFLFAVGIFGFVMPAWGPFITANEQWLGFFGSVIGGFITLIAALIAWASVQRQIDAQAYIANRQLAIVAIERMTRQIEHLEQERDLAFRNRRNINGAMSTIRTWLGDTTYYQMRYVHRSHDDLQDVPKRLKQFRDEVDQTGSRRWILQKLCDQRIDLRNEAINAESQIARLVQNLFIATRHHGHEITEEQWSKIFEEVDRSVIEKYWRMSIRYEDALISEADAVANRIKQSELAYDL